jgi:hypothetical protein
MQFETLPSGLRVGRVRVDAEALKTADWADEEDTPVFPGGRKIKI